jgi:hypothetical protein
MIPVPSAVDELAYDTPLPSHRSDPVLFEEQMITEKSSDCESGNRGHRQRAG